MMLFDGVICFLCVYTYPPAACSTGWGAAGGRADAFPEVWQDSANNTRWTEAANKVKQWKAQASNAYMDPKQTSSDPKEAALGQWINKQRKRKKQNKLETSPPRSRGGYRLVFAYGQ